MGIWLFECDSSFGCCQLPHCLLVNECYCFEITRTPCMENCTIALSKTKFTEKNWSDLIPKDVSNVIDHFSFKYLLKSSL